MCSNYKYCYTIGSDNTCVLYRLCVVRLEGKPRAFFWKIANVFKSQDELQQYCREHLIDNPKLEDSVIPNKVEYVF